jgi:hypothetical protein
VSIIYASYQPLFLLLTVSHDLHAIVYTFSDIFATGSGPFMAPGFMAPAGNFRVLVVYMPYKVTYFSFPCVFMPRENITMSKDFLFQA